MILLKKMSTEQEEQPTEQSRQYTDEEKASMRQKRFDRFNDACDKAIEYFVTPKVIENIHADEKDGYKKMKIATWKYVADEKETHDADGTQTVFGSDENGGLRLLTLINKERGNNYKFMNKINLFINNAISQGGNKYRCYTSFSRDENNRANNTWSIYVTWEPLAQRTDRPSYDRRPSGGRGDGGRGPGRGGRGPGRGAPFQGRGRGSQKL
jgi:hypothetical protein